MSDMSGTSYDSKCPLCAGQMMCSSDWKPYDCVCGECVDCGFCYHTEESQLTLEEVNDVRVNYELEPLTELRKQKDELI